MRQKPQRGARPSRYVPEGAFAPGGPVRPVDAMQAPSPGASHRAPKVIGIGLAVLASLLLVAYVGVAVYFTGRFMPNSTVGDMDVSLMSSSEVQERLGEVIDSYELSIEGQGFDLVLSASDAGVFFDGPAVVGDMLADSNPWAWPFELGREHDETDKLVARYSEAGLEELVRDAVEDFNATAVAPENATVSYDESAGSFSIVPEQIGTALDAEAVVKAADEALANLEEHVSLTESYLLQPSVFESDERLAKAVDEANTMIKTDLVLQMSGMTVGEVNAELVSQWVSLDGDLNAALDEGALSAWLDELASRCDTVGTERTYTRADGKEVTVSGGVYGWSVDRETLLSTVKDGVKSGRAGAVDVPCSTTGTAYNGAGARDWGDRYLDIDLSEQHVRFYDESGGLVWESDCVTGTPNGEHDTPSGVYWLNQKQSPSTLIGYSGNTKIYETEVQYWMPFVGNAIGLHDADWQPNFGGTMYKDGYGSHGCVNLPSSKAAELYGLIEGGDVVVCHW
ncbi:hypothetical protein B5F40_06710 [Gordonibacter sp. An230]|nr:hypothetical protein B5F40_06710 [Gordonibacter sp. An230]